MTRTNLRNDSVGVNISEILNRKKIESLHDFITFHHIRAVGEARKACDVMVMVRMMDGAKYSVYYHIMWYTMI